jgi:hypothetical protein
MTPEHPPDDYKITITIKIPRATWRGMLQDLAEFLPGLATEAVSGLVGGGLAAATAAGGTGLDQAAHLALRLPSAALRLAGRLVRLG